MALSGLAGHANASPLSGNPRTLNSAKTRGTPAVKLFARGMKIHPTPNLMNNPNGLDGLNSWCPPA
jgi:hypothetical protein